MTVQEEYEGYGVTHGDNCEVCNVPYIYRGRDFSSVDDFWPEIEVISE
jgi:hypothetical protein